MDRKNCNHPMYRWNMATNEDGWECVDCGFRPGEPAGYDPRGEVERIEDKVRSVIYEMHESKLIYVSNGDQGDWLEYNVVRDCQKAGRYDQSFIITSIMSTLGDSHSDYWKKIGDGVRSGVDERSRCECGELSTTTVIGNPDVHYCSECSMKRYWK